MIKWRSIPGKIMELNGRSAKLDTWIRGCRVQQDADHVPDRTYATVCWTNTCCTICIHSVVHACLYLNIYICMYVCMHACMYVCMRLLSSIFPQHSLSYKMPLRFQQLYHTRTYPLISQHEAHHVMLQNATAIFMMG